MDPCYNGVMGILRWHSRPWRVAWPPGHRPQLTCALRGRRFRRFKCEAFGQGQRTHTCSRTCRDLANSLGLPKFTPPVVLNGQRADTLVDSARTVSPKDRDKR
jgi:hypothetical protein